MFHWLRFPTSVYREWNAANSVQLYRFGRGSRVNARLLGRLKYRVTYNVYLDTLHQIDRNFTKTHVNLLTEIMYHIKKTKRKTYYGYKRLFSCF